MWLSFLLNEIQDINAISFLIFVLLGGRGGGGRMIIWNGVGQSYKAIDGTGGGGVAGLPIESEKTVGGSGIIIVTFDACGCVGP